MIFSSLVFLFLFLPIVLLSYFLVPKSWRNILLLAVSILFYSWGEGRYALLMVFSICINWIFGLAICSAGLEKYRKPFLAVAVILNLLPLLYFKYSFFLAANIGPVLPFLNIEPSPGTTPPHLPIGISFFTFQALSYLIDVYRDRSKPQNSLINIGLYIALFPQLIAGPIVRYHDIAREIITRKISSALFSEGITRFIFGLSKKMLIANPIGSMADTIFALPAESLSTPVAWLGLFCYHLQIYFDFSGYSDMAIGLGRMFGFNFLENFNYPYIGRSIREFWKRWHISLSNWFRDYLYIPLGGNRKGSWRTNLNLLIVFTLCGLWHGASLNFLIWGLSHGVLILFERSPAGRLLEKSPRPFQHFYMLFFIINSWAFFRIESLSESMTYLSVLYGFHSSKAYLTPIIYLLDMEFILTFIAGLLLATPIFSVMARGLAARLNDRQFAFVPRTLYATGHVAFLGLLFFLCWLQLAASAYNPFIYFRF